MKVSLHPQSRSGHVINAYRMSGFKVDRLIQIKDGRISAYISGRGGIRIYIDADGLTKFLGRLAA